VLGSILAFGLYLFFARALRIDEVTSLTRTLVSRVRR
jgi:hypothetical protein